jgi:hypothetical protein
MKSLRRTQISKTSCEARGKNFNFAHEFAADEFNVEA